MHLYDIFHFAKSHKSRTIGPSETNGNPTKTHAKTQRNVLFSNVVSDFANFSALLDVCIFEQKGNSHMAVSHLFNGPKWVGPKI